MHSSAERVKRFRRACPGLAVSREPQVAEARLSGQKRYASSIDVAKLAGVSQSAVSRTYKPGGSVAPETRSRVLAAAAKLNYSPSVIAVNFLMIWCRIIHQVDEVAARLVLSGSPQSLLCLSSIFDVVRLRITNRLDMGDSIYALAALARNAATAALNLTSPFPSSHPTNSITPAQSHIYPWLQTPSQQ